MKRAPYQPTQTDLCIYAGIFMKRWYVKESGTLLPQHAHVHAHITLLMNGAVRLWRDERLLGDFFAPATLKIPANAQHQFLTLTDEVLLACIHNADHVDGDEPEIAERAHLDLED